MENENKVSKNKPHSFYTVLVILLLIVIAISSVINTYYLLSINTKLSLLPKMDFSGIQNSLKEIGDSLDVGVLDMFR